MEDEIEVGEYVRTVKKGIKRIDKIFEKCPVNRYGYEIGSDWEGKEYSIIKTTDIVKHSKNIIDLIEVGDYVNGHKVIKINEPSLANDYKRIIYCNECEGLYQGIFTNEDIKSIVTHEQFEQIKYKVKE